MYCDSLVQVQKADGGSEEEEEVEVEQMNFEQRLQAGRECFRCAHVTSHICTRCCSEFVPESGMCRCCTGVFQVCRCNMLHVRNFKVDLCRIQKYLDRFP